MAKCFPKYDDIPRIYPDATEGEIHLLDFLHNNLSDDYEIYFQPYLNGDRPDIIVVRINHGILIIEVKDWHLSNYEIIDENLWMVKHKGAQISSPFKQVTNYKNNIYELHIDGLYEKKVLNRQYYSMVSTAIYLHNSNQTEIKTNLFDKLIAQGKSLKWANFYAILTPDILNNDTLAILLRRFHFNYPNPLFSDSIYTELIRVLQPDLNTLEKAFNLTYSKEQLALCESRTINQKIKGVAGCGKTLVLAKRAVNAYQRTHKPVLILTYNLTLINYIHDRISEIKGNIPWSAFNIINYHQFIFGERNNHNIFTKYEPSEEVDYSILSDRNQFDRVRDKINKYETILIDEGQDFQYDWFYILKDVFLHPEGEFVIFADEKQNIYKNDLDEEKKIKTNIRGAWNESLTKTFRLSEDIVFLANEFQKYFWNQKYNYDNIEYAKPTRTIFSKQLIEYKIGTDFTLETLWGFILEKSKIHNIAPNDIAILASEISILRKLENQINRISKFNTKSTFESQSVFEQIQKSDSEKWLKDKNIEGIRRSKKINFWMNPGTIKLSTIHSFKGWEIDAIFLILHSSNENAAMEELIYTGLTRAKNKLFIISLDYSPFDTFIKSQIK